MKLCLPILLFALLATASPAQQPAITPDMQVNPEVLHQWLHSGDPRLIAWAADFARRTHDTQTIAELPAVLQQSSFATQTSWNVSRSQHERAIRAVLDTLIEEKFQVPIPTIEQIEEEFPAQAAILVSRLPLADSRSTLNRWVNSDSEGTRSARTRGRVAAMLLAVDPDPNLVAGILRDSEENLQILLVRPGEGNGEGLGMGWGCGSGGGASPPLDWPHVYAYILAENDNDGSNSEIIDLAGDRIVARRFSDTDSPAGCGYIDPLDSVTRHRLIAYWLGLPDNAMVWQPVESESIVWVNLADYEHHLGEIVELHREQLQDTVAALRQRGLLKRSDDRPSTMPRLVVSVDCHVTPCPLTPSPARK